MKKLEIIVLKSDVTAMIDNITRYTGKKTESANPGALLERVATVEADSVILGRYWQDACAHVADALRSFIASVQFGREILTLDMEVSNSYDESLTPAVETGIQSLLADIILCRWFRIAMPDRAAEWQREAAHQFDTLLANLYHRKKPKRAV